MSKAALKGLRAVRLFPITTNDLTTYATGTKKSLPGAQELTKDVSRGEYTIYADDETYDTGSNFQYEDLELTLAELTLELEAAISGGTYDDTTKTYTFHKDDSAPEYALGYAALKADVTFRQFMHYCAKMMSINVSHKTTGEGNDIQVYKIKFRCTPRKCDGKVRDVQDSATEAYTWLDTVKQYPVV